MQDEIVVSGMDFHTTGNLVRNGMDTQVLDYPWSWSRFHPKRCQNKTTTNTGPLILFHPLWLHEYICVIPFLLLCACRKVVLTQKAPSCPLLPMGQWQWPRQTWSGIPQCGECCYTPTQMGTSAGTQACQAAPALPVEAPWLLWGWFPAAAISPPWDKLHPWVMVCGCSKKNLLHQAGQQFYCTAQQQWQWQNLALNYLYWTRIHKGSSQGQAEVITA